MHERDEEPVQEPMLPGQEVGRVPSLFTVEQPCPPAHRLSGRSAAKRRRGDLDPGSFRKRLAFHAASYVRMYA